MKKRNLVIDSLRVIAIIGAMSNHLMYPVSSRADFFGGSTWWISFFVYTFSLVSVPIFIMISGYLLIDKNDTLEKTKDRIITRLIIPLIFWFAFYLLWGTKYLSIKFKFSEIVGFIFSGNISIYYFLIILIGLYLLLPITQLIAKHGSKKMHFSILYGSFILTWITGFTHYFANLSSSITSLTTWWLPFFSYFWWGFMIKKNKFNRANRFLILFITCSIMTLLCGHFGFLLNSANITLAFKNGIFYWHDYLSPTISFMAIGLFSWAMLSNWFKKTISKPFPEKIINAFAPLAYGAYLVHMYVINYIDMRYRYAIEFVGNDLMGFVFLRPIYVILISFIISFLISKVPYLRKIIGKK